MISRDVLDAISKRLEEDPEEAQKFREASNAYWERVAKEQNIMAWMSICFMGAIVVTLIFGAICFLIK